LIHLFFDYGKDSQAIRTLFTQEMLKRGVLASATIYVSYSLTEDYAKLYVKAAEKVCNLLEQAVVSHKLYDLLEGPVVHSSFERLS